MKDLTLIDILEDMWYLFRHADEGMCIWEDESLKFEEKIRKIQKYAEKNNNPVIVKDFYPIKEKLNA